jgi:hypothetical protein
MTGCVFLEMGIHFGDEAAGNFLDGGVYQHVTLELEAVPGSESRADKAASWIVIVGAILSSYSHEFFSLS